MVNLLRNGSEKILLNYNEVVQNYYNMEKINQKLVNVSQYKQCNLSKSVYLIFIFIDIGAIISCVQ